MTLSPTILLRLQFLSRVVRKEAAHLAITNQRLFKTPFTAEIASQLEKNTDLAEQVDAFVSRFSRLQDTLGDKLLPFLLMALGEKNSSMIDNLDRAERLRLIPSTDEWLSMRNLRNQMIHEYVEDLAILTNALQSAHQLVPILIAASEKILSEISNRGWA